MADTPKRKSIEKKKGVDVSSQGTNGLRAFYCCRCGIAYGTQRSNFPSSHSPMYRGSGYIPICYECVDKIYNHYKIKLEDDRLAMRRVCMKFDLYWSDEVMDAAYKKSATSKSIARAYINCSNLYKYVDKCFDNTVEEEGLDKIMDGSEKLPDNYVSFLREDDAAESKELGVELTKEIIDFWGPGYGYDMLQDLEARRRYWVSRYPEGTVFDVGEEALIRQVCGMEIEINRKRSSGGDTTQQVGKLNDTIKMLNLAPGQKDDPSGELEKTPLGVWLWRYENEKPLPEVDDDMKDVNHVVKYITTWFLGHLCKMLGIKNTYCKMYEDEIAKMRVEHPEYEEDDDETILNDLFGGE